MLNNKPAWQALQKHHKTLQKTHMRDLFAADPQRTEKFHAQHEGLSFNYAHHCSTDQTMELLCDLARACDVENDRNRMFAGDNINTTENRAVLHTALRRPATDQVEVNGENIMPFIHDILAKMKSISTAINTGAWAGHTGQAIKNVVNIGIGGSDLGPRMACDALSHLAHEGVSMHFVSNVDGAHIHQTLVQMDPETTLFLVASKTFTTQETMANAAAARQWVLDKFKNEDAIARHFIALSTNEKAAMEFGIVAENIIPFRDWVGGRYSLWSAIGLPICIAVGFDNFRKLLNGAYAMDQHFQTAPLEQNMPVLMALLGIWYRNFCDAQNYAILPYAQNLRTLPGWLQQLDMESNGKAVNRDGHDIDYDTAPVVFGVAGTDCQHSFMQMIHQGTSIIPCDFIGTKEPSGPQPEQHKMLTANMEAQARALMQGRDLKASDNNPHKVFTGNRPSNTIMMERLDAYHLGMLLALYEHKIFVQGVIWNINSFDQWGVELGKIMAADILKAAKN